MAGPVFNEARGDGHKYVPGFGNGGDLKGLSRKDCNSSQTLGSMAGAPATPCTIQRDISQDSAPQFRGSPLSTQQTMMIETPESKAAAPAYTSPKGLVAQHCSPSPDAATQKSPEAIAADPNAVALKTPEAIAADSHAVALKTPEAIAADPHAVALKTPEAIAADSHAVALKTPEAIAADSHAVALKTQLSFASAMPPGQPAPVTPCTTPTKMKSPKSTKKLKGGKGKGGQPLAAPAQKQRQNQGQASQAIQDVDTPAKQPNMYEDGSYWKPLS